jgi:hypothetical protein
MGRFGTYCVEKKEGEATSPAGGARNGKARANAALPARWSRPGSTGASIADGTCVENRKRITAKIAQPRIAQNVMAGNISTAIIRATARSTFWTPKSSTFVSNLGQAICKKCRRRCLRQKTLRPPAIRCSERRIESLLKIWPRGRNSSKGDLTESYSIPAMPLYKAASVIHPLNFRAIVT